MVTMENSEEILQILERFTRLKQKEIPKELEDYLQYVAKTGDTIFKWASLKYLFREKLLSVIKHFNEDTSRLEDIPNYPNVDPFNYETMKSSLLERLDLFNAAPFTVQRLCELLIDPRKQYSRIDKFMRALEKNILVVSTVDPGRKRTESENGDSLDSVVNGDLSLEVNIDIEMENEALFNNVDERNGNSGETAGNGNGNALKASCPRTDDTVQPKAKKAKFEFDDTEPVEPALASTEETPDLGAGGDSAVKKNKDDESSEKSTKPNTLEQGQGDDPTTTTTTTIDKVKEVKSNIPNTEEADDEKTPPSSIDDTDDDVKDNKDKAVVAAAAAAEGEDVEKAATSSTSTPASSSSDVADGVIETAKVNAEEGQTSSNIEKQTTDDAEKVNKLKDVKDSEKESISSAEAVKEKNVNETEAEQQQQQKELQSSNAASSEEEEEKVIVNTADVAKEQQQQQQSKSETPKEDEQLSIELNKNVSASASDGQPVDKDKEDDDAKVEEKESPSADVDVKIDDAAGKPETNETEPATPSEAKVPTASNEAQQSNNEDATPTVGNDKDKETEADTERDIKTNTNTNTDADADKKTESETEKETEAPTATASADTSITIPEKLEDKTTSVAAPMPIETDESTGGEVAVATATAAPIATATASTVTSAPAPPTLALNDQPMEDTPADEETTPAVDEVVMADGSNAASGEMATDEAPKDELAAMEVDDTSQEVMDQ